MNTKTYLHRVTVNFSKFGFHSWNRGPPGMSGAPGNRGPRGFQGSPGLKGERGNICAYFQNYTWDTCGAAVS